MSRGTQLEIRPKALRHNARLAKQLAGNTSVYAMVKANAYGHGLAVAVAAMAPEVQGFGVALMQEAEDLLQITPHANVLLLEGCFDVAEWQRASELGLAVILRSPEQLQDLQKATLTQPLDVWIKVDTGMHRLGFRPEQLESVVKQLNTTDKVRLVGLASHLACADVVDHPLTAEQLSLMASLAARYQLPYSIANSAAIYRYPEHHGALVRPGIMLYGATPLADQTAEQLDIAVTQRLTAPIIAFTDVPKGETVGYGASWRAPEDSRVAVVAMGYGDGYPRHAPAGTPAAVNNQRTQLVGRVSMDMLTVDVTHLKDVKVGDTVELWGDVVNATEVADACGTISYELFCQVTARPQRIIQEI